MQKKGHPPYRCWKRPDVRCNKCKQLGHIAKICKSKSHQATEAQVADHQEEQLFAANCLLANCSKEMWLVDSACSNHMTSNLELFKELEDVGGMKVKIGNGDYMEVKGRGTIALETSSGTKMISNVLFVPEVDQNLLSVGQLLEKGFKLLFEDSMCVIKDDNGQQVFRVSMKSKCFPLDLKKMNKQLML